MKKIFSVCAAVAMMAACAKEAPQASVPSVLAPAENAEQMEMKFQLILIGKR